MDLAAGSDRPFSETAGMKRFVIASLLGATLAAGAPAHAAQRCVVVATGLPGNPSGCTYTATGPGTYAVATATGFVVSIQRGAQPYVTVAGNATATATTGSIPSVAGDVVNIGIRTAAVRDPNGAPLATIQDGVIAAIE